MVKLSIALILSFFMFFSIFGFVHADKPESPKNVMLPGLTNWADEGYNTNYKFFLKPTKKLRAVMIFVDFPNAPATAAPEGYQDTKPYYEWLVPDAQKWFKTASYNRLDLEVIPINRWYRMNHNDDYYNFQRGINFEQHVQYIKEAVQLSDEDVDFSKYDLVYIVPSKNASAITFSPAYIDATDQQINADGKFVTHGATFGQDMWQWGYKVLNHETLHTFGLPDLYSYEGQNNPPEYHYYVGGWDLMGLISGHSPDLFAWHKWKLGWLKDTQVKAVTKAGTTKHTLTPVETNGGTKMVVVRTGKTTAYVVESRRRQKNDTKAIDSGVLIYKVDSSIESGYGPIHVIDATPNGETTEKNNDIDVACFGVSNGKVSTFNDLETGVKITVLNQTEKSDIVQVEKTNDTKY